MSEHHTEFGKRRPLPPPASPPEKRSGHIALLLMGTLAVGGSAYALMPWQPNCEPTSPGISDSPQPQAAASCSSRGSSSSSHGSSGGSRFYDGDSSSRSTSASASEGSSSHVARGGFGSFAHAFGFSRGG